MTKQIQSPAGPAHAQILGVGGYRPSRVVTNEQICQVIDSTDEWITTRTGIKERR
jgi:3-oxoacyl-[acyl-carrier-protein] synthase-3